MRTCSPMIFVKIKVKTDLFKKVQLMYGCFGYFGGVLCIEFKSLYTHYPIKKSNPRLEIKKK